MTPAHPRVMVGSHRRPPGGAGVGGRPTAAPRSRHRRSPRGSQPRGVRGLGAPVSPRAPRKKDSRLATESPCGRCGWRPADLRGWSPVYSRAALVSRESCALDARAASFVRSRTPRTARPRLRTGLARPIIKRRTPRVAAPGVHVPRRRRLRLRWVAPRSLAKTGLRRKGYVRPDNAPGPDFVVGPAPLRKEREPSAALHTRGDDCRPGSRGGDHRLPA